MRKQFYFSAIICVLLSVFAFSVSADYYQPEQNAKTSQSDKQIEAIDKNQKAGEARSLMQTLGSVYDQNIKKINRGKRLTLGSVFSGAATVTIAYVSGGSTFYASVPSAISTAVQSLGLAGSINASSELESAYESALSALQTRIWETSAAIARYRSAWNAYSLVVSGHNSSSHGGPYSYTSAHTISKYQPPSLNEGLPSFSCPDGSCGLTWSLPSTAREAHYARCGTLDDPYNKWLKGCYDVYYTCNTSETSRHKPQDCGLSKWIETTHGWTETSCPGDYRKCTQTHIQRPHSTILSGVNVRSTCGGSRPSPPDDPPPDDPPTANNPPPPPTDNTPNCQDCTSHCSSPCSCTNSGTCNGTVATPPPTSPEPTLVACGGARYSGCSGASSRTKHHVPACSKNCGNGYWTCDKNAVYNHEKEFTCRRCGATFTRCSNGACPSGYPYHWAQ